jgi:superfamily II DNA/RNA helicase
LALSIAILQLVNPSKHQCQVVVAVSTKEQADNIMKALGVLGKFLQVKTYSCMNATTSNSIRDDIRMLSHGAQVVVGTISRIQDMVAKKTLRTEHVRLLLFEDAEGICLHNSKERIGKYFEMFSMLTMQVCLFTENLILEVNDFVRDYIKEPLHIEVKRETLSLKNIKQFSIYFDEADEKIQMLMSLWGTLRMTKTVVFCSGGARVEWLSKYLELEEYEHIFIHSEMKRAQREEILNDFRSHDGPNVLLTDDIRGMHFEKVPLVINFDPPLYREGYMKRCGRYYNHKAVVINFTLPRDIRHMQDIKRFYEVQIADLPVTQVAELAFEVFRIL